MLDVAMPNDHPLPFLRQPIPLHEAGHVKSARFSKRPVSVTTSRLNRTDNGVSSKRNSRVCSRWRSPTGRCSASAAEMGEVQSNDFTLFSAQLLVVRLNRPPIRPSNVLTAGKRQSTFFIFPLARFTHTFCRDPGSQFWLGTH
jgi:hypothetical protein